MRRSRGQSKKRQGNSSHAGEDQYGGIGASQDREEAFGNAFSKGSFSGGGSAGISMRRQGDVVYQRTIPKFLQQYKHLLGNRPRRRVDDAVTEEPDTDDPFQDEHEAVLRAIEENPALAKELNPDIINKATAEKEKEQGNYAYRSGNYTTAVARFTACIELDSTNPVYFSNRSAVHVAMKSFEKAVEDAEAVIRLKPKWVKGWARLAVARFGLGQYSDSKEAYTKALEIEPDDQTLVTGLQKAEEEERRHVIANKHTFKKRKPNPKAPTHHPLRPSKKSDVYISYDDDGDGE